jgi:hypothetical protein
MIRLYPVFGGTALPILGQTDGQERATLTNGILFSPAHVDENFQEVCVRPGRSGTRSCQCSMSPCYHPSKSKFLTAYSNLPFVWGEVGTRDEHAGSRRTTAGRDCIKRASDRCTPVALPCSKTDKREMMVTFPGSAKGHSGPLPTWMKQA